MKIREKDNRFQGLWPAMFTPVKDDGTLNTKELEKLIELLVAEEVDGLYLLGSTGQGFLFSEKERMEIAEVSLRIINKRLPVMVQVGALNTDESVRLAKHAYHNGADAISSVGPIYYGGSVEMAVEHYRKISGASDLPFFPYQIGNAVTNDELIRKLSEIPNIGGLKLTTLNLLEISSIYHKGRKDWSLFSGADELLCQAALCGTAGAIGSTYNLSGQTCKLIRSAFLEGEVQVAMEFMLALQRIIEQVLPYIWTFYRKAMQLKHGIDIGKPKPPLMHHNISLTDDQVMDMVNELDSLSQKLTGAVGK
jgi:N-acetylneuraminate lyase